MHKFLNYILIIFTILFGACNQKNETQSDAIASIGNSNLLLDEILQFIPKNLSPNDSILFIQAYTEEWIINNLLYQNALQRIRDTAELNSKVRNYKKRLYVNEYLEQEVYKKLNRNVSPKDIENYYNKNLSEFVLNETYVKAYYLTMTLQSSTYYRERYAVMNTLYGDQQELLDFCSGTGRKAFFHEDWIKLNDLLAEINYIGEFDHNSIKYDSLFVSTDNELRYIVKIFDYSLKGENPPIELVQDKIAEIIINKRRKDLRDQSINDIIYESSRVNSFTTSINVFDNL